jgi:hypothetical protein
MMISGGKETTSKKMRNDFAEEGKFAFLNLVLILRYLNSPVYSHTLVKMKNIVSLRNVSFGTKDMVYKVNSSLLSDYPTQFRNTFRY